MGKKHVAILAVAVLAFAGLFYKDEVMKRISSSETQVGSGNVEVLPDGKIQRTKKTLDAYMSEVTKQFSDGFAHNYAEVSSYEEVELLSSNGGRLLPEGTKMFRLSITPVKDPDSVLKYLEERMERQGTADSSEVVKKLKETGNYGTVIQAIGADLRSAYGDVMDKGYNVIVEEKDGNFLVWRVGDYVKETAGSRIRVDSQRSLLTLGFLTDFLNYGVIYRARTDAEVRAALRTVGNDVGRKNLPQAFDAWTKADSEFSSVYPLVSGILRNY